MSDSESNPGEMEALDFLDAVTQRALAVGSSEHVRLADEALAQLESWMKGKGTAPTVVPADQSATGVRSWVSYQSVAPSARKLPTAHGMAHWRDERGGYHLERGTRTVEISLTDDQLRQLGL